MRLTAIVMSAGIRQLPKSSFFSDRKNRSLWTRAHLAFWLRTHNLVLVAKGT